MRTHPSSRALSRPLAGHQRTAHPVALLLLLAAAATAVYANTPTAGAVAAWDKYVAALEKRVDAELANGNSQFLVIDTLGAPRRDGAMAQMRNGEVFITRMKAPPGSSDDVPDALLHHWLGAILVRDTTVDRVIAFVQDYDHHAGRYADVIASRTLSRDGDRFRIFLKLQRSKFKIETFYDTEHEVEYRRHAPDRASSRSRATRITQLEKVGTPQERVKAEDSGYLWRLNSYWRFKAVPEGVVVECESASLSRTIPWLFRLIVGPFIDSVPRSSLEQTLTDMRKGVLAKK
jgi:hypothetical protein